jgi:hypothetical protein
MMDLIPVLASCPCGSLWQKRTSPFKRHHADPASTAKLTPKWKRSSDTVAPRAHTKVRKMLVRKIRKEAGPSSTSQEAPIAGQVWITPLIVDPLLMYILT